MWKGRPPLWAIVVALATAQIGAGAYAIIVQKFVKNAKTDAIVFSMARDSLAFPLLLLSARLFEGKLLLLRLREVPFFLFLGCIGMFANQLLYIQGLYYTTPNVASILQPLCPVFTCLLAFCMCLEALPSRRRFYQWFKVGGIVIGTSGALLMCLTNPSNSKLSTTLDVFDNVTCSATTSALSSTISYRGCVSNAFLGPYAVVECTKNHSIVSVTPCSDAHCGNCYDSLAVHVEHSTCLPGWEDGNAATLQCKLEEAKNQALGTLFLVCNTLCYSIYLLVQKKFIYTASDSMMFARWKAYPIHVSAYSYLFGALAMLATVVFRYAADKDDDKLHIHKGSVGGLAYAVIVSSAMCYGLVSWGNKWVSPAVVTSFWPLQVFTTVLLSFMLFNESPMATQIIGMTLIVAGMFTVTYGNSREQKALSTEESQSLLQVNSPVEDSLKQ